MNEALSQTIEKLMGPFLKELDLILVDLKVHSKARKVNMEILVDHPQGGVTLAECTQLNRKISAAIDQQNIILESYVLEVSSPGLDRPLKTAQDFLRVVGRPVRLFLSQPFQGKIEYEGIIQEVKSDEVLLGIGTGQIGIPFRHIHKGRQMIGKRM